MELSKLLANKMLEENLTQNEIAKRIGISKTSISKYISNQRTPSLRTLAKISAYLGVENINDLMEATSMSFIETLKVIKKNVANYNIVEKYVLIQAIVCDDNAVQRTEN